MILTNKQRKLFTILIVIATIGLLITSILPFLTAFR